MAFAVLLRRAMLTALIMLAITGCAKSVQERHDAFMAAQSQWLGQPSSALFQHEGQPSRVVAADDGGQTVYYDYYYGSTSGPQTTVGVWGGSYGSGVGVSTELGSLFGGSSGWCSRAFSIDPSGIVRGFSANGTSCY